MILSRLPSLGTVYLTGLLLGAIPIAPTGSLWLIMILIGMQGILLVRPNKRPIEVIVTMCSILILPQAFSGTLGIIPSLILVLPTLVLFDSQLGKTAIFFWPISSTDRYRITITLKALGLSLIFTSMWGVLIDSFILSATSILLITTLFVRLGWEYYFLKSQPILVTPKRIRTLAGTERVSTLEATNQTRFPINFTLRSQDNSVIVDRTYFSIDSNTTVDIPITIKCQLSGPSRPQVRLGINGPRGLLSITVNSQPLEIRVIPRARYASWLAEKYLKGTGRGVETTSTDIFGTATGKMQGVEFQQLREYQPGDKLRQIDWNHTHKFGKFFIRERLDPTQGDVMIILNTVAENPEEADWIAYNLVMSSLSASQQGLPTSILAYNDNRPVLINNNLKSRDAVEKALHLASRIHRSKPIGRHLTPPNLTHLRRFTRNKPQQNDVDSSVIEETEGLNKLLLVELNAIKINADNHPIAPSIRHYLSKATKETTITLVSCWNHDSEILTVTIPKLRNLGYRVIDLMSEKGLA